MRRFACKQGKRGRECRDRSSSSPRPARCHQPSSNPVVKSGNSGWNTEMETGKGQWSKCSRAGERIYKGYCIGHGAATLTTKQGAKPRRVAPPKRAIARSSRKEQKLSKRHTWQALCETVENCGKLRAAPEPPLPHRTAPHTHTLRPRARPLRLGPAASCQVGPGAGRGGGGAAAAGAGTRGVQPCAAGPGPRGAGASDPAVFAALPVLLAERCYEALPQVQSLAVLYQRGESAVPLRRGSFLRASLSRGEQTVRSGIEPFQRSFSVTQRENDDCHLCASTAHAQPFAVQNGCREHPSAPHWLARSPGRVQWKRALLRGDGKKALPKPRPFLFAAGLS